MITVQTSDSEKVRIDAEPENVSIESNALVIRRDKVIIARFRRHVAWYESTDTTTD